MRKRGISGVDLASQVEISQTALSQILNGVSTPRQSTFGRLLNRLCETEEERQELLTAYTEVSGVSAESMKTFRVKFPPDISFMKAEESIEAARAKPMPEEEAARYLEAKAASIAFETDIKHLLDEARIPHIYNFNIPGKIAVDFVTKGKTKIAVECKTNLTRDWERVLGTCMLVKRNLPADNVVVVIPYHNATSKAYEPDFTAHGIFLETPASLIERLKTLGA